MISRCCPAVGITIEITAAERQTRPVDNFDALLDEAAAVPLDGWDFSWFDGRATEERPSWGYASLVADRLSGAETALDVQTGGGEVFAWSIAHAKRPPHLAVAVEQWQPEVAARKLDHVVSGAGLPFRDAAFDLVVSRHPVATDWSGTARILRPGGRFLSQQIGDGTNRELSEAMLGPLPPPDRQHPEQITAAAEAAGFEVLAVRGERLRVEFFDIAAVAHFLRKVIWTVPDFTIEKYRPQLRAVHDEIIASGRFVSHSARVLIEAEKCD
jgi:SAM-dependent methyltransferase